jgi:hypothetical protein
MNLSDSMHPLVKRLAYSAERNHTRDCAWRRTYAYICNCGAAKHNAEVAKVARELDKIMKGKPNEKHD